jgi:hypothetical protein
MIVTRVEGRFKVAAALTGATSIINETMIAATTKRHDVLLSGIRLSLFI